ncbi:hypothetical protein [Brasilonema sp. UFV-L1]|uniref:hypothetical protein n=1 Tax=Brasilonema sp. UFV-L1 TaxID=2234130 RepID=UPI00145CD9A2|nr:hypothetical protein [Brasilonema sp. UFV-L1]NMG07904.1 hypothetical protein [Brasilonema sp. UFV-L1]
MDFLKEQIVEKLEHLSDDALAAAEECQLSHLSRYEPYDWEPREINEGLPVRYIPGKEVMIIEE